MSGQYSRWWLLTVASLVVTLGVSMNAYGFGGKSWKEEVLLHDGSKIIVERTVERSGQHEIGQEPPIKEQSLTFNLPSTNEQITWEDKFTEDVGGANFLPMLLDVHKNTAYLAAHPMGSLSYMKWGSPNPPYVVFKYQSKRWNRITLQELPMEFTKPNLIFSSPDHEAKKVGQPVVPAEVIKRLYDGYRQPEFRTIVRTPLDHWKPRPPGSNSGRMVRTKDGWVGMDWFEDEPSIEACLKLCEKKGISPQDCPCHTLFKGK